MALKPEDKLRQKEFAVSMEDMLDSDPGLLKRACFNHNSTFDVS